ncbi:HEPN domain-containing protein [bacterium]|nr:HEPN domain-containing protein [bacterium]MBU1024768.1 HEPN domain-containing protein [bacterium]
MESERNFDPDAMIRKARIKARGMQQLVTDGNWDNIITDAYNVMYMAARGALSKLGYELNTHQTVASHYRHQVVEKDLIDMKFANHLTKIKKYWENEQNGQPEEIDQARAERIVQATLDLVDALAYLGRPTRSKLDPRLLHYNK